MGLIVSSHHDRSPKGDIGSTACACETDLVRVDAEFTCIFMDVFNGVVNVFHAAWLFGLRGFPVVDHDDNTIASQSTSLAFAPLVKLSGSEEASSSAMVPNDASIVFIILDFVRRDGNQFNLMGFSLSLEIRNFDTGKPILLFLESLLKLIIFIEVVVHQCPIVPRSQSPDTFLVWKHIFSAIGLNLLDQPTDTLLMFFLEKRGKLSSILSLLPKPSTSIFLFFIAINLLFLLFLIALISILLPSLPLRRLLNSLNGIPILIQTRLLQDHFSELGDWVPGPLL